jgi:hypothetical protein
MPMPVIKAHAASTCRTVIIFCPLPNPSFLQKSFLWQSLLRQYPGDQVVDPLGILGLGNLVIFHVTIGKLDSVAYRDVFDQFALSV